MNRRRLAASCIAILFALVMPGIVLSQEPAAAAGETAAVPAADWRARFTGTFAYAGGARGRAAITEGIERGVADMNFITRPIARGRLEDSNPVYRTIGFAFEGHTIRVILDGSRRVESPDTGATAWHTRPDGERVRVSQGYARGKISQLYTSDDGQRRNEYSLDETGTRLTMRVRVTADALGAPVTYSLSYRRR